MISQRGKSVFKLFLKLAVAGGLIAWFLHKTDTTKIVDSIRLLSPEILLVSSLLTFFAVYINSIKWWLILPEFSVTHLFKINLIGQFYALILLGQLMGDAAKAYLLGKGKKTAETIAASVLIDKITGLTGLLMLGIVGVSFTPKALPLAITWSIWLATIFMITCLFCLRINIIYNLIFKTLDRIKVSFKKTESIINRLEQVFQSWHDYSKKIRRLFYSVLFGILYQLISIGVLKIMSSQLAIEISFIDWCWIFAVVSAILILPISIGGIGVREGALVGTMGMMGVIPEKSLALSFSLFGFTILLAIAGGLWSNFSSEKKALSGSDLAA